MDAKEPKRPVKSVAEIPGGDSLSISRLCTKISDLSVEIDLLEYSKKSLMAQLAILRDANSIDYNIRGENWTYEQVAGRTTLREELLLAAGVTMKIIAKCKRRGASYWQVRRDREKKEKD